MIFAHAQDEREEIAEEEQEEKHEVQTRKLPLMFTSCESVALQGEAAKA